MPSFETDRDDEEIDEDVGLGRYVLQDYVVSKWTYHVRAVIEDGKNVKDGEEGLYIQKHFDEQTIEEFTAALHDFITFYEDEILPVEVVERERFIIKHKSSDSFLACRGFHRCEDFINQLVYIWHHIWRHEDRGFESRNQISLTKLKKAVESNRKCIEAKASDQDQTSDGNKEFISLYGENVFKCDRLNCVHFHDGFTDEKHRELHIKRHTRPYQCVVYGCTMFELGFQTNKDLEKHMKNIHPNRTQLASTFEQAIRPHHSGNSAFTCHICGKKFTREFIRKNHIRSHNGDRPFTCDICGKAFTRANDCRRHERTVHSNRNRRK